MKMNKQKFIFNLTSLFYLFIGFYITAVVSYITYELFVQWASWKDEKQKCMSSTEKYRIVYKMRVF